MTYGIRRSTRGSVSGTTCLWKDMGGDFAHCHLLERTRLRPLAAGTVTPYKATAFLGLQLSVGLAVLTQLNWYRCVADRHMTSIVKRAQKRAAS
jgi:heme O synthase-like polyprenyltransferase